MPAIKLEQFGGMLPAWDPHLLPTGQAALAQNTFLFSGALTGWRQPKLLRALKNSAARRVYRIPTVSQAQAKAYLVFVHQPDDGTAVVIGDIVYTFRSAITAANDVLIGATTEASAANLTAAVTADQGQNTNAGVLYGTNTVANGDIYFTQPNTTPRTGMADPWSGDVLIPTAGTYAVMLVGALDFGAAFNLINVSTSTGGAPLLWLYDTADLSHVTTTFTGGSNPTFDTTITAAATWLEFVDPDTDVIRSPVVDDQWNRYYWASPSAMPSYNTYDRITAGLPSWLLGVPPPGCAPTLSVTGGGNSLTLGNTTTNGTSHQFLGNTVLLQPITTPGATILNDIQWQLADNGNADQGAGTATQWAGVIYQDNNGVPGALLAITEINRAGTTTTNIASFTNTVGLLANTQYWIGIIIDTANYAAGGPTGSVPGHLASFSAPFSNGPPGTAPVATLNQPGIQMWGDFTTSDILEARSYAYTWVSRYGEEGPPSPPSILDGWSNGTWTVGLWQPPADDLGVLRDLTQINLYRTVVGQGGSTVFFYVATIPIGTATYVDANPDSTVAFNNQLASTNWFPPPANLQGLTVMQNGMVAGFIGNEVWFCEPFRPHAWPPGYVLTVDYPIVGLGVTNGALIVCTSSHPHVVNGHAPAQMAMTKCSQANPCSSRASIVGGDNAVSYISPNGLIQVTAVGQATNTTELWITREKWQQLTPPRYSRAIYLASCFYCLGSVSPPSVAPVDTSLAQTGFTLELDQDNASFTIWPQPGGHRLGFEQLTSPTGFNVQNVLSDPWSGTGLIVSNGNVYYFDFSDTNPALQAYSWKSKVYQQNVKRNYSAMKVFFQVPPSTAAQNATRIEQVATDPAWALPLPVDRYGYLKTYCDWDGTGNMVLIDCREIRSSGELLRIVDGFKAEQWQFEVDARVVISNIQVATSAKELGSV